MISTTPAEAGESADLLIFGDLTASFDVELRRLLHVRGNEAMTSFFERVALRLRQELGRQPSAIQNMFPRFTTLIDLVSGFGDKMDGEPVMQFFLMTVCQLAKFIHFASGRPFPSPQNTYLLGICTGSFAASAICVSQSVPQVVVAGVEATMAAFRTALRSVLQRDMITTAGNKNWSAVVSRDKPVNDLIVKFTNDNVGSSSRAFSMGNAMTMLTLQKPYHGKLSNLYISATTPFNATVSGPPDSLNDFFARNNLAQHRLPIESPFHAPHIFHEAEVESVLEGFPADALHEYKPRIPIISGSTGGLIDAADFKSLLRTASTSVLREMVEWEKILATLSAALGVRKVGKCNVYPFYYNSTSLLSSHLTHEASMEVAVHNMIGALPAQQPIRPTGRLDQSKIAVIGYSGRFPEATSNDEFWNLLRAGRDVHRTIPEDRFNWETYHDPTGKKRNTSKVKHGCFINEPGLFDTQFFNMSPREANSTDPAHRLAITATYEAMEMAGMVPNRTPSTQQDRIGVFFGVTSDDWREVNSSQDVDTYFIPGGVRAFMPGRISYFFRFSGPSLCIDTACSSSFAAIQSACGYLLRGECDTAVAGGTNVLTNPDIFTGLDRGHFLAKSGNCNTFDDEASGYCRAEGVGAVILKRLEDALEDQDPIFGVIAGSNTNHCGQTDSITRPHEGDQVSVFKRVLRYQGVDPNDISYVEMHGTGTQAGDATEMRSVLSVFLPDQRRGADRPLYLGSAKANVGHSESASGVVSLIKALMMMKNNEIPPHCGIKTRINRNYPTDLAQRNVRIASRPTPWRREDSAGGTRRMFLNNFSAAGGNTAILLEDAPSPQEDTVHSQGQRERGTYLVAVTAKSAKSLAANLERLVSFLEENPSCSLPALSYTTTARRIHHGYRVAFSGASIAAVLQELKLRAQSQSQVQVPRRPSPRAPKVAFVFTGQGNLYTSMGRELYETVPSFREDLVQFNNMAQQHGFPPFLPLIDGSVPSLEGVETCVGHLALACLQMALSRLWNTWNVRPSVVVGHSLGEYAALFAAGVISASDAILLVGTRATLLTRHCTPGTHGMMAIKAAKDSVLPLLADSPCEITCINQPGGTVVGGEKQELDKLATKVQALGYSFVPLDIPFSFHTSQVDPILAEFQKAAQNVQYSSPNIPILSPLLGRVIQDGEAFDGDYLVRACRGVVNFQGALEAARLASIVDQDTIWLEMGSHPACSGMIKGTLGPQSTTLACVRNSKSPWSCIVSALEPMYIQGLDIDWNNFHRDSGESHQVIQLPRYSWDLKNYWIAYKNDWLLTKGDCCSGTAKNVQGAVTNSVAAAARYISPSIQRVLQESHTPSRSTILAESDLFDTRLVHVLRGHKVNGVALCPSSLYGDVALTVGKALVEGCVSAHFTGLDVCDVKVDRPLIAHPSETSCLFRVSATADWASQLISVSIYSVDQAGNTTAHHAKANVRLSVDTTAWLAEWNTVAYLIRGRIASLERGVASGNSHKLKRSMVYKLFTSIVDYSSEYQGMQEVILDSEELEAAAKVSFRVGKQGFYMNPHWIDSLGHLAGFIMNGNEYSQSDQQVFINHGWSRLRFGEIPREGKVYTTYNKMQLVENKLYAGDTYVLDGDRIIAMFDRVAFQAVPRKIIGKLLPNTNDTAPVPSIKRHTPPSKETWPAAARAAPAPVQSHTRRPSATPPSGDLDFPRVLTIIAEEVGIAPTELQPDIQLVDFGLDSLLSLTISSRINDEMGLDLPSTLFAEHPTVKDLQSYFAAEGCVPRETPELTSYNSDDESSDSTVAADEFPPADTGAVTARIRQAIADETGIPVDELESAACLADLGVDSLLSLTIADSLTEALGAEVSSELLLESRTLKDLEATLGKELGWNAPELSGISDIGTLKPSTSIIVSPPKVVDPIVANEPHATSILLRRASTPVANRVLFLLPDGSGSAASYASLAKLDAGVKVYGVNCPWRTNPEQMTRLGVTTHQVVAKYVAEIRRNQPHGPYYLGGWSAGGLFAFEATRELMAAGEVVEKLLLIDAPNPIGLENPPSRMFDFFESAGVFGKMTGGKVVPKWLRHHFDSTVNMLDGYVPRPLPGAPPSVVIYARDGICKGPDAPQMETAADDPREMLWLLRDRTDFSAAGWASLLGRDRMKVHVLSDVNHFSMMDEGPRMEEMRGYIRGDFLDL
ncbi:Beta-ketoacyl synthase [Cordyceps fumosorosea ARSEF 2679]|uniref:Beta-ketoacyl synthase n=1 Tax=Cordyceps fumosorosea (strain ARSEF 2679) TaxID=1081104 RepID=A0A168BUE3_CORFA|nr:Beta-ketoacyl synthase [Cordyceps fumosorosea ARSEF 2679]OAA70563.1 Beta-ketoacyl synthase [Cordyceps fumosorosea ARSEF 2679]